VRLLERAHREHGVVLLGVLHGGEGEPGAIVHRMRPEPADETALATRPLKGVFGMARSFAVLRGFAEELSESGGGDADRGDGEGARGEPLPGLGICPVAWTVSKVLIRGFHEGLIDFCEQLILLTDELEVFVVVPEPHQARAAMTAFVNRPVGALQPGGHPRVRFRQQGPEAIGYARVGGDERRGTIHLLCGDWSNEDAMLERAESGYRLADMDAVLLTYTQGESDPDARTALRLLKLIRLKETRPRALKPNLRVICEVQSTEKADLFQRRFVEQTQEAAGWCHSLSVVAAERVRNAVLAQSVFVPGITALYRELLSETGHDLLKLLVRGTDDPSATLSFGQLLTGLYRRDGLLVLGVELVDREGNRRLVVNPAADGDDYRFSASELVGVLAIGDARRLPVAPEPCDDCFAADR